MSEHPARAAALKSVAAVMAGDKDTWLGLFAPDAIVQDPIGPSFFDESGEGHRGTDAISAFWDQAIAPNSIDFRIRESYACGEECANLFTIVTTLPTGDKVTVEGVATYKVNSDGRLEWLRAFWQQDDATFEPAPVEAAGG